MSLIRCNQLDLEFGDLPLLTQAEFAIEPGERVCLIGRNGSGKSSLMKIIAGELRPDHGELQTQSNLRISQLRQDLPHGDEQTVYELVASSFGKLLALRHDYEQLSHQALDDAGLHRLHELQQQIEASDGWSIEQRVDTLLSELQLPAKRQLKALSGGWRRRAALAAALVTQPDLLLLDEPTNHLDISTIEWLEARCYNFGGSILFVTHDRSFLQHMATRILELDRGVLTSWPGNYQNYLLLKEKALQEEATHNALFDKKLAQEEVWIRQGIKARRTRNEGRVRALEALREQRKARINRQKSATIHIETAEQSGRKVIEAHKISYAYNDDSIIEDFSLKVMRGDRIGIVGNNGVGKSTLLRLLLNQLSPQHGTVKHGTNLQIAYFDQLRDTIDFDKTVAENIGEGREFILLNGKERHVISYLQDFLFSPKRAMSPVSALSGGECNRLILAKLFTRPANLLVLDEPTNDLDVETLEVLEEKLSEYNGTLLIVSHDREFLDNVVTSVLVFEADGLIHEYVGGYADWATRKIALLELDHLPATEEPSKQKTNTAFSSEQKPATSNKTAKLSYKLQRELDQLPKDIEALEKNIAELQAQTTAADFYQRPYSEVESVLAEITQLQTQVEQHMERWLEIETLASS